jgi:methylase of polypeptide subunit release factors
MRRTVMERVCGGDLIVTPGVFNPVVFRTGKYFANFVLQTPLLDEKRSGVPTALDMGCGSGILAVCAAHRRYRVTAVDIDERALECTKMNAAIRTCSILSRRFGAIYLGGQRRNV